MKKITLGLTFCTLFLVGCNSQSQPSTTPTTAPSQSTDSNNNTASNDLITKDEAVEIALNHANLSPDDVTLLKAELEWDGTVQEYEIEFHHENQEYDYEIHGGTGEIRHFDRETESNKPTTDSNVNGNTTNSNSSAPTSEDLISQDDVKEIALDHANLTLSDVTFVKVSLEWEKGIPEYEVEFYHGNEEYDYEIHGETGEILSFDKEVETPYNNTSSNIDGNNTPSVGAISKEDAKEIALTHANLIDSDISNYKIQLDYDNGVEEYELEWSVGKTEYEYTINANTGEILEYDLDYD